MVIGFDASRAFVAQKTGTENYSYQILTHLAKIDRQNTYLVFLRPNTLVSQGPTLRGWPKNFKFITLPYPKLWTQVGLAWSTFNYQMDILFIPAHTLPLIRKPGLKTVLTVHDLGAEYLPKTHQLKQRLYLKLMTDFQLQSATHLIAVSQATKSDIIYNIHIQPEKISVIYEGYNQKLFRPVKDDTLKNNLKAYHLEPKTYFLFVGTIQPRKNLERLIKAYAVFLSLRALKGRGNLAKKIASSSASWRTPRNDVIDLVIAGSKGWLADEIYALPKKLGLEKQIKFLGYVLDEKLPALYSGAQAFLFPSLFEGFGLPILEAMSCGCPVLTSNLGSMKEICLENQIIRESDTQIIRSSGSLSHSESFRSAALLVNPYSIDDIAYGVKKMMNKELRIELTKLGFKQIQKFSWEKAAQETLKVITSS